MCGFAKKTSVQKLWREKANMQRTLTASGFRAVSGTTKHSSLREGQLVGRMLLQRQATDATGVKQARYRRGPTRGTLRACAV